MNLEMKRKKKIEHQPTDSMELILKTNSAGGIVPARRYTDQKSSHRE